MVPRKIFANPRLYIHYFPNPKLCSHIIDILTLPLAHGVRLSWVLISRLNTWNIEEINKFGFGSRSLLKYYVNSPIANNIEHPLVIRVSPRFISPKLYTSIIMVEMNIIFGNLLTCTCVTVDETTHVCTPLVFSDKFFNYLYLPFCMGYRNQWRLMMVLVKENTQLDSAKIAWFFVLRWKM